MSNLETGARSKEKSAVSPREKNRVFRLPRWNRSSFPCVTHSSPGTHARYTLAFPLSRVAWARERAHGRGPVAEREKSADFSATGFPAAGRADSRGSFADFQRFQLRGTKWNEWFARKNEIIDISFPYFLEQEEKSLNHMELPSKEGEKEYWIRCRRFLENCWYTFATISIPFQEFSRRIDRKFGIRNFLPAILVWN